MSETRGRSLPELSSLGNFHVSSGPESLLQLLPQASRKIIGRILDLGPESRATMEELRSDEWFNGISACSEENRVKICGYNSSTVEEEHTGEIEKLDYGYALY